MCRRSWNRTWRSPARSSAAPKRLRIFRTKGVRPLLVGRSRLRVETHTRGLTPLGGFGQSRSRVCVASVPSAGSGLGAPPRWRPSPAGSDMHPGLRSRRAVQRAPSRRNRCSGAARSDRATCQAVRLRSRSSRRAPDRQSSELLRKAAQRLTIRLDRSPNPRETALGVSGCTVAQLAGLLGGGRGGLRLHRLEIVAAGEVPPARRAEATQIGTRNGTSTPTALGFSPRGLLLRNRKGPDFRAFSEVAGAGFEPATFGL